MKSFLVVCLLSITFATQAQRLNKVVMSETGDLQSIAVELDENVVVNISPAGEVGEYGIDIYKGRTDRMQERLEQYTGKVDRYTDLVDEAFRGKIRYIGMKELTYYSSFEDVELAGKLKSIGTARIEYYNKYDEAALRGKIKRIGSNDILYYSSFDASFGGKVRSIGPVQVSYYTNFEDKAFRGKVKSIGSFNFVYYSSYDRKELAGHLKSGWRIHYVNGIKFMLK
ncbi:MAG: hypothetical protein EOO01_28710 [Chitinophagaceae bacterium]|nr:MAG: hypothetical protein EOO01_28710 [Chitinophagaceae bacterium]